MIFPPLDEGFQRLSRQFDAAVVLCAYAAVGLLASLRSIAEQRLLADAIDEIASAPRFFAIFR